MDKQLTRRRKDVQPAMPQTPSLPKAEEWQPSLNMDSIRSLVPENPDATALPLIKALLERMDLRTYNQDKAKITEAAASLRSTTEYQHVTDALEERSLCQKCRVRPFTEVTSCNHGFCSSCFEEFLRPAVDQYRWSGTIPQCPLCSTRLSEAELANVGFTIPRQCMDCGFSKSNFYPDFPGVCKTCVHMRLREGKEVPNANLRAKLKAKKVVCSGCNSACDLLEDRVDTVCHPQCGQCLTKAYKLGACQHCNEKMNQTELNILQRLAFNACALCEDVKAHQSFVLKHCCPTPVCLICQIVSEKTTCAACNHTLAEDTVLDLDCIKRELTEAYRKDPRVLD